MELALGTVQFGLPYGIAGRDARVPEDEVRAILRRAFELGIRVLDTAAAYGDIEGRLCGLTTDLSFSIVTKLPAVPAEVEPSNISSWAEKAVGTSARRLGSAFAGLLFHRAEDLLGDRGAVLWNVCAELAKGHGVPLGVSCYDPGMLDRLRSRYPIELAQLPANAFDQRLRGRPRDRVMQIHLRSVFLQGLLVMPADAASARVPAAAASLAAWHAWCANRELQPLTAALGIAKGMTCASHCVVGVDDVGQLEAIASAWQDAPKLQAPELAVAQADVFDPRRWNAGR
jgi:hypothetical protein